MRMMITLNNKNNENNDNNEKHQQLSKNTGIPKMRSKSIPLFIDRHCHHVLRNKTKQKTKTRKNEKDRETIKKCRDDKSKQKKHKSDQSILFLRHSGRGRAFRLSLILRCCYLSFYLSCQNT